MIDAIKKILAYLMFVAIATTGCFVANYGKLLHEWSQGSKNILGASIAIGGMMLIISIITKEKNDQ